MSFSAILDKVGGLLSKTFLLAALLPALSCVLLNGYLLYFLNPWLHRFMDQNLAKPNGMSATALGLFLIIFAYAISALSLLLTEILEGKHWFFPLSLIKPWMIRRHFNIRKSIRQQHRVAQQNNIEIQSSKSKWIDEVAAAAESEPPPGESIDEYKPSPVLEELKRKGFEDEPATFGELSTAVAWIKSAALDMLNPDQSESLQNDWNYVLDNIDSIYHDWFVIEVDAKTELETRYGSNHVAPTAFGNVAESVQSYGLSRYGFDLSIFWTSLQSIIQTSNPDFFCSLDEAKAQLDFFVAHWWLWTLSWVGWEVFAVWNRLLVFAVVNLGIGLLGSYVLYFLATRNYGVMASYIKSAIDLYRLSLLKALNVNPPAGLAQERNMWKMLQRGIGFGNEFEISYSEQTGQK